MNPFTVEEMNLICCFSAGCRSGLIREMARMRSAVDDPDMRELMSRTADKLEAMTDEEFGRTIFVPVEEFDEETEEG